MDSLSSLASTTTTIIIIEGDQRAGGCSRYKVQYHVTRNDISNKVNSAVKTINMFTHTGDKPANQGILFFS